jgi:hypothetical protein
MLPVTTRPPRRPGGFGSPYGKHTEIDLAKHDGFQYVLPKGCWMVKCGLLNGSGLRTRCSIPAGAARANGNGE